MICIPFLLKKNVRTDIIKTILKYSPITVPETLKQWKVAIISVKQGKKSDDKENNNKEVGFVEGLEQAWYKKPLYIAIP